MNHEKKTGQTAAIVSASELGQYTFCARSWWYQHQGFPSVNQNAMESGKDYHHAVGKRTRRTHLVRIVLLLLLFITALFVIWAIQTNRVGLA